MPIFQDDFGRTEGTLPTNRIRTPLSNSPLLGDIMKRKASEESIRTELCEGLLLDSPPGNGDKEHERLDLKPDLIFPKNGTSDRAELIERLKRGESPTWLPNRNLEMTLNEYAETPRKPTITNAHSSPLLPSPEIIESHPKSPKETDSAQVGLQIERPRSALHSGDFTEGPRDVEAEESMLGMKSSLYKQLNTSAWLSTSPPGNFSPFQLDPRFPPADIFAPSGLRSRAPSLSSSYSSSFILKPPTSPLVQSESHDDLDLSSRMNPIDIATSQQRNPRRHTLQTSHSFQSNLSESSMSANNRPTQIRRESNYHYQAHQPRRSLNANQMPHPSPSPQTPSFLRSRRPSYTSDASPRQHASMVGSYEESILRGRMSTTPSRPLDFVAQIGVLGLGKCKSSLRCPAHVTIPFPAVFYSYETTSHGRAGKAEDGPSPYVGQIDLENSLQNPDEARDGRRKRQSANLGRVNADDLDMIDAMNTGQLSEREVRRAEKQKRRSTSPRAPPGGSYRIPEKGQLQIIIKNPNKTAVKLFLVPYDLAGMEPGTKTFIRQRSYSGGPIIDTALSSTHQVPASSPLDRPTLRYLVHLHVCSPSKGRFFLYKSIRVVFANRVPDGKEKLRNEISLPEPRFSVYKPGRESALGLFPPSSAGASLAAEKAFRRRSSGFPLTSSSKAYDSMDGITQALERGFGGGSTFSHGREQSTTPVDPIPFALYRKPVPDPEGPVRLDDIQSPTSSKSSQPPGSRDSGNLMQMSWTSNSTDIGAYDKLSKGDVGYGGNIFASSPDGKQVAESLLARKLRSLGVGSQLDGMDGI